MNVVDWIAVALIAVAALGGARRGLITGVLSLVGLVAGALAGSRVAPALVGDADRYIPLFTLGGAFVFSIVGQSVGGLVGSWARRSISVLPPLRVLDSLGGIVFGAATALAVCWAAAAALLYVPGQTELRRLVQESSIASALTDALPPGRVMAALGDIDPFSSIIGPSAGVAEPDPAIARDPEVARARRSVVRVRGVACGLGIEGSGWIVAPGLVVTNAHVVAGVSRPIVDRGDGDEARARVVSFDAVDDVAVLRVPGLRAKALVRAAASEGAPAAVLGFPGNGPYRVVAARVGRTRPVAGKDAYGRERPARPVVALRGAVRSGNSGGPLVDARGRVVGTVFARRLGADEGYAVPNEIVRAALARAGSPLRTSCVER